MADGEENAQRPEMAATPENGAVEPEKRKPEHRIAVAGMATRFQKGNRAAVGYGRPKTKPIRDALERMIGRKLTKEEHERVKLPKGATVADLIAAALITKVVNEGQASGDLTKMSEAFDKLADRIDGPLEKPGEQPRLPAFANFGNMTVYERANAINDRLRDRHPEWGPSPVIDAGPSRES